MNKLVAVAIVLATSATIRADSLEEKKYWKGQMDYLQQNLDSANKDCGAKFSFAWVDKPKLRTETVRNNNSPNGVCGAIIDEVDSLCRSDDDSKKAVNAKIKGFTCGWAKPRTLQLSGGIVHFMGNFEESNFSEWAKPWLEKHL